MNIQVVSLREDPTLKTDGLMQSVWPRFMGKDQRSMTYWKQMRQLFPEHQLCLVIDGQVAAYGNSIPIHWIGQLDNLPISWTETLVQGVEQKGNRDPNTLAAVNVAIHPNFQRLGLSKKLLTALKEFAITRQYEHFVVPVRPSFKVKYPLADFDRYIHWKNENGEPFDPWIRTHWKLGANIIQSIPQAMTVTGTIAEWEDWTGMKFPESGPYVIEGALQPIDMDCEINIGTYVDPNVWMQYQFGLL